MRVACFTGRWVHFGKERRWLIAEMLFAKHLEQLTDSGSERRLAASCGFATQTHASEPSVLLNR